MDSNPSTTEWEFTAEVASWINEHLSRTPRLPFFRAKCEQRGFGSQKRRDLTLLDKNQIIVLTGEFRMPWAKDGGTPYIEAVVQDARQKAQRAGVRFFFTWNVNEFVLWETFPAKTAQKDRSYKSWKVTQVHKPEHLEISSTIHALKSWLETFLSDFANIYLGTAPLGTQLPDEKFLQILESSLRLPILFTLEELEERYKQPKQKAELDRWMLNKGWTIVDDPEGVRDNLERAAQYACYALVNKLVFHEALLKRYAGKMAKLTAQEHLVAGDQLRQHLEGYFQEAKVVTADYETVFGEEHTGIGNRIPFYADEAVPHWRALINQIHDFDFSKLDYEVIGSIFERLLSPSERRKYGQFYTRPEVVDLINSFCIRTGQEKVMDPACGGGTFLVRAYARKRELAPLRQHGELLADLFGVDIDEFATHLTTINLATRDLIDAENYPQIVRSDFFDLEAQKPFMSLPARIKVKGLGKIQHRDVEIPPLDAVIGNPPYVRQEQIRKAKTPKKPEPGTKEYYQDLVRREMGADLGGRSDIHCYFWPHAASFLKEDGWLCLLTSSQWLDVEYGFRLQQWLLRHFEIVAVLESIDEPWFVGARVVTAVTILRRQPDEKQRMNNLVRFVQLRRPIREILAHDGTTAGAVNVADAFRDEILSLASSKANERYRVRLVRQGDLWREGVSLGVIMGKSRFAGDADPEVQDGDYYGGKWGIYLRAPDLWFNLLDEYGAGLTPLGSIAEVRFGVKSGNDSFFFPIDASEQCLAAEADPQKFADRYGVPRKLVASGKVKLVRCGEGRGEIRPIEAEYLEPEIHSIMEVSGFTVAPEDCSRLILYVGKPKIELKGTYALGYIKWGEEQNVHLGATVAARVTKDREWYDLTGHERAPALWPKERQYRHIAPANNQRLISNCRLYEIYPHDEFDDPDIWGGILNSSWTLLSSLQFGRPVGNEGNWSTMVVDVAMMLVPNPSYAKKKEQLDNISKAFRQMQERKPLQFLSEQRLRHLAYTQAGKEHDLDKLSDLCELDMPDRRELDDAVLEMLGVRSAARRQELIDELYRYLREFFEWTRQKEEKAIVNKLKAKRRGQAGPTEIAAQILAEIRENHPHLLSRYDPDFLDLTRPFDTFNLPAEGSPQERRDLYHERGVVFMKGKKAIAAVDSTLPQQDPLIILLARLGLRGLVRLPHEKEECVRVFHEFSDFLRQREDAIRDLIAGRTLDEETQEKICEALKKMI
ncbi:MAG: SAM-dependent methyltransferase [Deltaproteobacteria bacterium]|nr:SAM-dependent methyltransferase [Deltaproteobacteria bacterium]